MRMHASAFIVTLVIAPVASGDDTIPSLPREFRGVWVATVANIDWPSKKGLPVEQQKAELRAILHKAADLNLNAVIFQVRPMADALYASKLEPWSEFLTGKLGQAPNPNYDPLEFAVREAHALGLELHAWFNPYRARSPSATSPAPAEHLTKARPDLARPYGKHSWMNPTHPEVQAHSLAVILDVVRRYDVDGVHVDDYFYPYKEKDADGKLILFPDDDTWKAYQDSGGKLARDDWRRDAVNRFVESMYREVKAAKPWVKVGISPFGIWRPGNPPGIEGFDQYAELYADARLWLRNGWVDYFSPQLYWPIKQEKQSYPRLLAWWAEQNVKGRLLWPGNYTGRVSSKGWPADEIFAQIEATRAQKGATGNVHFSMKTLMKNPNGVADAIRKAYAEPALGPATPWSGLPSPGRPRVTYVNDGKAGPSIRVDAADMRRFVVRQQIADRWTIALHAADANPIAVDRAARRILVSAVDRAGMESPTVTVEPR